MADQPSSDDKDPATRRDKHSGRVRKNVHVPRQAAGTVFDRIRVPPMSGEEALRRFDEGLSPDRPDHADGNNSHQDRQPYQSELSQLSLFMKVVSLGGTLLLIVGGLLAVLYLFAG
ncbi:hypothetical protein LPB41_03280 [Thalassospira sp. MA62]|nr:hypothetical protein [Thalassospira sp. MA62]